MNNNIFGAVFLFGLLAGGISISAFSADMASRVETTEKVFSLHLGVSRIIFDPTSHGATITISNKQEYPILVESEVLLEDQKTRAPFIVTPPLFRIEGFQSSRLRIVRAGGAFPEDRESLNWLCVKGIPPKDGDKWAEHNLPQKTADKVSFQLLFSVNNCIKFFVRPSTIAGNSSNAAEKVKWMKIEDRLKAYNPTPFYINFSSLTVDGKEIKNGGYIAPFSHKEYKIPVDAPSKIQWSVITDYGGISKKFDARIKK
ncbi:fimbria/pilus periplasmic chaperone [Escherichia coli]|nr:fimbria/pilus periplasmic chaperone [Escherichia coli]